MNASILDRLRMRTLNEILSSSDFSIEKTPIKINEISSIHWPAVVALNNLRDKDAVQFKKQTNELGGIIAQCEDATPLAVLACMNLGAEFLVDRSRGGPEGYAQCIETRSCAWLFAIGWKILFDEVSLNTCEALIELLERSEAKKNTQLQFLKRAVERAKIERQPWLLNERLDPLEELVGPESKEALKGLLQRFPKLPANDGPIYSMEQIQATYLLIGSF